MKAQTSSHYIFSVIFTILTILNSYTLHAEACDGPVLQLGWFAATQGKSQHINIDGLIGDDFSLKRSTDQNFLIGLGYYFDGLKLCQTNILYGINAFYLAPTKVKGNVTQEDLFTNLSYRYSLTHYPIYFSTKALVHCSACSNVTIDLGIGPNILCTRSFKERSLDEGITVPDAHVFKGKCVVTFSATAGLGWRINEVWENFSIEIDYRFFYLGQGELKKNNNQLKNNLRTGHSYANALFLSISM